MPLSCYEIQYFFFIHAPGAAFPLFVMIIAASLLGLAAYTRQPISRDALWLLLPLGFFSAMVAVRASIPLTLLNLLACLALHCVPELGALAHRGLMLKRPSGRF